MANPSQNDPTAPRAEAAPPPAVDAGNYELIRERLLTQARELAEKADALNEQRKAKFGSTTMSVIGNERVRTENNCVPRDIVAIGDLLLFAYNVHIGLKTQTAIEDVFSVRRLQTTENGIELLRLPPEETTFLQAPDFVRDFDELYRYYKDTRLVHLQRSEIKMLAVFQTSPGARDYRVLRWAIEPGEKLEYIDNRGERDYKFPASHDFEWVRTTREDYSQGRFPHVSILDEVFVETTGGDLTIKVEDNTEEGEGIYSEPVDDLHQSLDDAEVSYAKVGVLILIKIRPYREEHDRYLVFNTRTQDVKRIDAIGRACIQLPGDHGIIFPGGYYLNTGETRTFAFDATNLQFESMIRSPNGEDVLYTFYEEEDGLSVLLPYNLIRKEVLTPISVHGYCTFEDGKMIVFKAQHEPTRVHPVQIWLTPFISDEFAAQVPQDTSFLGRIGNPDLVRGISDCHTVRRMIDNQTPTMLTYEDIIAAVNRTVDAYHWLADDEAGNLLETLEKILATSEKIIDEFEKVVAIRKRSEKALAEAREQQTALRRDTQTSSWSEASQYIDGLGRWRRQMGRLFALRDMKYIDTSAIDQLDKEAKDQFGLLTRSSIEFMIHDDSLDPYKQRIDEIHEQVDQIVKTADMKPLREKVEEIGNGFDLLTDIVSGLEIEDPTVRTQILEQVSEVYSQLNRTKAHLDQAYKELLNTEGVAQFGVEFKLLAQSVTNSLATCDTPEKTDDQLSRLMVQLEDLEARFGEFDQFLGELAEKREEVYEAFEGRKRSLLEERQRRAQNMMKAADRILQGIARRAATFKTLDDLNTFFVSDPMVGKIRDIAAQLRGIGEGVRADELFSKLKSSTQEAARAQRDRADLFEGDENAIKLGRHKFTVTSQDLELTLAPRDGQMFIHLTGTDFFDVIEDPELAASKHFWDQQLISENSDVYRCEYLAANILFDAEAGRNHLSIGALQAARQSEDGLLGLVRKYAEDRYDEGYDRGVHDSDTVEVLEVLLDMRATAGLLKYAPRARALGVLFWAAYPGKDDQARWALKARNLGRLRAAFQHSPELEKFAAELGTQTREFLGAQGIDVDDVDAHRAGAYLSEELATDTPRFVLSAEARKLQDALLELLDRVGQREAFVGDLEKLDGLRDRFGLATAWIDAFLRQSEDEDIRALAPAAPETAACLLTERQVTREVSNAISSTEVTQLLGQHSRIQKRTLRIRLDEFLSRLGDYLRDVVPRFKAYRALRHDIVERERRRLRLEEFKPRILSSFVRNKLINDVYLPIVGDNLAKQMGALGAGKRTDLMGLLLLISPPGYGKTTLMEYIANRLGLIFMKINGPALGHSVTSIDPSEAPNATSRQEVEKLNLALEMGNNVMLYVDDIQHTNPEFLQKFISLCDATRRIEGVWRGRTRTYDLRGKRFCVVMAGNPYTESGEKFQIPDMLSNRADTYNLGDILDGREAAFALSYLENALTSNPVLAPLASRAPEDVYLLLRMAQGEEIPRTDLSHDYTQAELDDITSVLQKLFVIQKTVLMVNQQYIASASQADEYRTEPPFKLQGSYRNMNKMAEKVVTVMNDAELEALIQDHYVGEAQTLTTGAEQNLLKLAEIRGTLTEEQADRWNEIKRTFGRLQMMAGDEEDPVARIMAPLSALVQEVRDVKISIADPVREQLVDQVRELGEQLVQTREGMQVSISEQLHAPLSALVQQLVEAREGMRTSVAEEVAQPLALLAQQVQQAQNALTASVAEDVSKPLLKVSQQLAKTRLGLSSSLSDEVAKPLAELVAQVVEARNGMAASMDERLAKPLAALVEQIAETRDGVGAAMSAEVAKPLAELASQLALTRGGMKDAVSTELAIPLAALVKQVGQARDEIRASVADDISKPLALLVDQMAKTRAGLRASISQEISKPLSSLTQQLAQGQTGVQETIASHLATPLETLSSQMEETRTALVKTLEEVIARQLNGLVRQADAMRKQAGEDRPSAEAVEQLKALNEAIQQTGETARGIFYKPLLAMAHQVHAIRKGMGEELGQRLLGLLDQLSTKLDVVADALRAAAPDAEAIKQIPAIARELEELRYTLSAAIHNASPELSDKLDSMRNK